jgi:hypothetical protein
MLTHSKLFVDAMKKEGVQHVVVNIDSAHTLHFLPHVTIMTLLTWLCV